MLPREKKRSSPLCLKLRITDLSVTCYVTRVKLRVPPNGLAHWLQVTGTAVASHNPASCKNRDEGRPAASAAIGEPPYHNNLLETKRLLLIPDFAAFIDPLPYPSSLSRRLIANCFTSIVIRGQIHS